MEIKYYVMFNILKLEEKAFNISHNNKKGNE